MTLLFLYPKSIMDLQLVIVLNPAPESVAPAPATNPTPMPQLLTALSFDIQRQPLDANGLSPVLSAYQYYSCKRREDMKIEDPTMPSGQFYEQILHEWKCMKETGEREQYEIMSVMDQNRYQFELIQRTKAQEQAQTSAATIQPHPTCQVTFGPESLPCRHRASWRSEGGFLSCVMHSNPNCARTALDAFPYFWNTRIGAMHRENTKGSQGEFTDTLFAIWDSISVEDKQGYADLGRREAVRAENKRNPTGIPRDSICEVKIPNGGWDPRVTPCQNRAKWLEDDGRLVCSIHSNKYGPRTSLDTVRAREQVQTKPVEKLETNDQTAVENKKVKDTNAPKRALSAYLFYAAERRPELKKEDPTLPFGDLTQQIAAEWKQMIKEDKIEKYKQLSIADHLRYRDELAAYRESLGQTDLM